MSWVRIKRWWQQLTADDRHYCKRRLENCIKGCTVHPYCDQGKEDPDYWYPRDGALTCSYCGGLKPSEVLRLIENGEANDLESTDKFYKFYLNIGKKRYKVYMQHFDKENFDAMTAAAKKRDIVDAWKKRFIGKDPLKGYVPEGGIV